MAGSVLDPSGDESAVVRELFGPAPATRSNLRIHQPPASWIGFDLDYIRSFTYLEELFAVKVLIEQNQVVPILVILNC